MRVVSFELVLNHGLEDGCGRSGCGVLDFAGVRNDSRLELFIEYCIQNR